MGFGSVYVMYPLVMNPLCYKSQVWCHEEYRNTLRTMSSLWMFSKIVGFKVGQNNDRAYVRTLRTCTRKALDIWAPHTMSIHIDHTV